jgi:hypothetical protein
MRLVETIETNFVMLLNQPSASFDGSCRRVSELPLTSAIEKRSASIGVVVVNDAPPYTAAVGNRPARFGFQNRVQGIAKASNLH